MPKTVLLTTKTCQTNWTDDGITFAVVLVVTVSSVPREVDDVVVGCVVQVEAEA